MVIDQEKLAQYDAERAASLPACQTLLFAKYQQIQTTLATSFKADAVKLEQQHVSDQAALEEARQSLEALRLDVHTQTSTCNQLRTELAAAQAQRTSTQSALEQARLALEAERVQARGKEALYEQRLTSRDEETALRAQVWEAQKANLDQVLRSSQQTVSDLESKITKLQEHHRSDVPVDQAKVQQLHGQLAAEQSLRLELQREVVSLKEAASSFASRYDKNALVSKVKIVGGVFSHYPAVCRGEGARQPYRAGLAFHLRAGEGDELEYNCESGTKFSFSFA